MTTLLARGFAALAFFCYISAASAGDIPLQYPKVAVVKIDCALTSAFNTRPLFVSAGVFTSKSAAQITDLNCGDGEFYGNIWTLVPLSGKYGDGGEVDVRLGWAKKFGPWGIDISVAEYNYRLDGQGVLNSLNARSKVSYDFMPATSDIVLRVYGVFDYQRSFDFANPDAIALAGGAYVGRKLTPKLEVGIGGEAWKYERHFAPNTTATIFSVGPQVSYKFTDKVTLFGRAAFVSGSVLDFQDHGVKSSYVLGVASRF